ncbi:porin [Paraflavitalea sp. CAU 1676]|uniref:porin n=1 Tax=Paraflavitalea sp. CAU 1676 TaxID=3032598 RepID=UPI0023D9DDBB|nr:porin [Paraflavitalea sp. CAU 1676]MDF2191596.1 porin [Paraflavitalea sp. CAU 1676]
MRTHLLLLLAVASIYCTNISAQQKDETSLTEADTISNFSAFKRSLSFSGVLQTRYMASLNDQVDVNGKHFNPSTGAKGVRNTFLVKRARIMVKANINDHFSANILANLADFNGTPANKVLENAYIKYSLNKYFNVQAGQFRPFFGIEDAIAVDIIRTLDFSNQYYAFGRNGWQSFQIGLSVFGQLSKDGNLRYFAGVYNGNNRNQPTDDDNTKNVYGRLEATIAPDFTVAMNAGLGSMAGSGTGNAWGGDATAKIDLTSRWQLLVMAEYKSGSDFLAHNSSTITPKPAISQFRTRGFYFFPTLRYEYEHPRVRAIELSTRCEWLDENYKQAKNGRQTIIPNVSLIFADNFYAALQVGVAIDRYKHDIRLTNAYSYNLAYAQLQIRF